MALAVDISNYSGPIQPQHVDAWRQAGVSLVIVQAVDPPAGSGYPTGCTAQQLSVLNAAGMPAEVYVFLWFDADLSLLQHALSLLDGSTFRRIWLDLEDIAARSYTQADTEAKVQAALDACDAYARARGLPLTGIYTGQWFWAEAQYMGNTTRFKDRLLWDANYDDVADATANFRPYGGWTTCAIKQYVGTSQLGGVQNVDQSALHPDYAAALASLVPPPVPAPAASSGAAPPPPVPLETVYPVPAQYLKNGWTTWREVAINLQGIADAVGQQVSALQTQLASDADATSKLQRIRDIINAAHS